MNEAPRRKPHRLKGYDRGRSDFITICTQDRKNLLQSQPVGAASGRPPRSPLGKVVEAEIQRMQQLVPRVHDHRHGIMPNHVPILLQIKTPEPDGQPEAAPMVSDVINHFNCAKASWLPSPQKRFHDHIIRDEDDFQAIWVCIDNNPKQWTLDRYDSE